MKTIIRIKRRGAGEPGAPVSLASAELAFNEVDRTLYYGLGNNDGKATEIIAIAGSSQSQGTIVITGDVTGESEEGQAELTLIETGVTAGTYPKVTVDSKGRVVSGLALTAEDIPSLTSGHITDFSVSVLALPLNQFAGPTAPLSANSQRITSLAAPVEATDAVTKGYVDSIAFGDPEDSGVVPGTYSKVTVDAAGRVTIGDSLEASDIPPLTSAHVSGVRLDELAAPTAGLALNGQRLSGVAEPTANSDAATKAYVDSIAQGLDPKTAVRVATTANVALSGLQIVDGHQLVPGERVLVKAQTAGAENGIYVAADGPWSRSADADTWDKLTSAFCFIEQGSTQHDTGFYCTADEGTLGVTDIVWTQFAGAGEVSAGDGLAKAGSELSVITRSSARITVGADGIDLATSGVTAGTYRSVTVDDRGRVTAGANPTTLAGYGIADAQPAITASGILKGTGSGVTAATAGVDYAVPSKQGTLTYAATVDLNFSGNAVNVLALTGDVTFTTSNRAAPRGLQVIVSADASARTLTFPSNWIWLGTKPTTIAASKTGMLSLYCKGTAESDVIAGWAVQS